MSAFVVVGSRRRRRVGGMARRLIFRCVYVELLVWELGFGFFFGKKLFLLLPREFVVYVPGDREEFVR